MEMDGERDELEHVLYAYETASNSGKSLYSVGPNGIGPAFHSCTYKLVPRPGYRNQSYCCGLKLALSVIAVVIALSLIITLVIIYATEEKAAPISGSNATDVTFENMTIRATTFSSTTAFVGSLVEEPPPDINPIRTLFIPLDEDVANLTNEGCDDQHCHRNAECVDEVCRCRAGYEGDGIRVCANINECRRNRNICGCNAICRDVPGSFRCQCKAGYEQATITAPCKDVDECKRNAFHCPDNSECFNVSGGYRCVCGQGFKPSGNSCQRI